MRFDRVLDPTLFLVNRYLYIAGWKNKETAISDTYARDAMTQVEVLGCLREVSQTINKHLLDIDHLTLAASNNDGILPRCTATGSMTFSAILHRGDKGYSANFEPPT